MENTRPATPEDFEQMGKNLNARSKVEENVVLTVMEEVVLPALWKGQEDAQFAVLMDNDGKPDAWVRSADWAVYGRQHGFWRVARIQPAQGPLSVLERLVKTGDIIVKDGDRYVGIAADGVEVMIGEVGREASAAEYLRDHPLPSTW